MLEVKTQINDLAFFGGARAFETALHVGRPNIGNREMLLKRINDALDRRWLTNGGIYVKEFESQVESLLGVKHCIAMCNATIALGIVSSALGLKGEVIIPSFTFIATAHALQWQGITPVFCDVDPHTHNLDPKRVEKLITPQTSGILPVHVWGRACAVDELAEIAHRHNLHLMYDAAHAFHCSYKGKMIGNFGEAEVFSFHATKFFNTFEGGAVTTNNDDLATRLRQMKNFGFVGFDKVGFLGTNGKMSEISAAMGLTGLESLDEFIGINQRIYMAYWNGLKDIPGVQLITYNEEERDNYQYVVVEIDEGVTGISRDALVQILHAENVLARRYFYPGCHKMEPYRSLFPNAGLLLPETEVLTKRVLSLPTGTGMQSEDVERVCELIRFITAHGAEISEKTRIRQEKAFQ